MSVPIVITMKDDARRSELHRFLMGCRARLQPQDVGRRSIGRRRVPGLRREEVAELAGITPIWYTLLEMGRDIRVSPRVLDRIASALRMTDDERIYFFSLALEEFPTLSAPALRETSHELLDAFISLRTFSRMLWNASSEEEALGAARDYCVRNLAPDAMLSVVRMAPGDWRGQGNDTHSADRCDELHAYITDNWSPILRDELLAGGPPSPELALRFSEAAQLVNWPYAEFLLANIQSRNGFVARLAPLYAQRRAHSETENAILGTVADLTSFALAAAPAMMG
jgi:transcriptional regulator with XRE-family HTH domain